MSSQNDTTRLPEQTETSCSGSCRTDEATSFEVTLASTTSLAPTDELLGAITADTKAVRGERVIVPSVVSNLKIGDQLGIDLRRAKGGIDVYPGGEGDIGQSWPFIMRATYSKSGNWRSRCGCDATGPCTTNTYGQSYFTIVNNMPGRWCLRMCIVPHNIEDWYLRFNDAEASPNHRALTDHNWVGPGGGSYGHYMTNGVMNQWSTRQWLIMVTVITADNDHPYWHSWFLQVEQWGDRGRDWFHCGQDFTFEFTRGSWTIKDVNGNDIPY